MAVSKEEYSASGVSNPAGYAEAITPSSSELTFYTRALYVGVSGDIVVKMAGGDNTITFKNVPVGILPIRIIQLAPGTTASEIIGLY